MNSLPTHTLPPVLVGQSIEAFSLEVTEADGSLANLVGYGVFCQFRRQPNNGFPPLLVYDTNDGSATAGLGAIEFSPKNTGIEATGQYLGDVFITLGSQKRAIVRLEIVVMDAYTLFQP